MKVAIMQPYFFPYIGYFQLINAVDIFIIYDDVNFIKQGWITRNSILLNKEKHSFILEVGGASSFKKIKEITLGKNNKKLLKTIEQEYKKAPFFSDVFPIIQEILLSNENNLSKFLMFSLRKIAKYLQIDTVFRFSSEIDKNNELKGQDKVIAICKKLEATNYINAIGGQELYNSDTFKNHQISLNFIKSEPIEYTQFDIDFIPWLSVIDVIMFNSIEETKLLLNKYDLV
ncbi:WbqC family protein [Flavobacterium sp. GT2N3]|uniref:WbqC family protein n=1 Tax=unclassified Flavobacterium TaxID=196869 RepID=UPI003AAB1CF8